MVRNNQKYLVQFAQRETVNFEIPMAKEILKTDCRILGLTKYQDKIIIATENGIYEIARNYLGKLFLKPIPFAPKPIKK